MLSGLSRRLTARVRDREARPNGTQRYFPVHRLLASFILVLTTAAAWAAPTPTVTVGDANPFLGSPATVNLTFANTATESADVGYGPYIDLIVPVGEQELEFTGA